MTDDLRSLAHDLAEAPRRAQRDAVSITEHAAVNVKNGWRDNARASAGSHAPAYPDSITYDMGLIAALAGRIDVEIGPDKAKTQGPLGNLIEFGSVHNPPHNDGGRALQAEAPKYETAIAAAALDALGWH